ncbi:hypothetical protein [Nocardia abscessus]|uniref:hypothetical protein n=1 Tax=Nocardia abscessus TaxID=120957 RepID=UPI0024581F57|nr:hypothetical protein [Nocardia abscessus]
MNSIELKNMLMGMLNDAETDADDNVSPAVSRRDLKTAMMAALESHTESPTVALNDDASLARLAGGGLVTDFD